MQVLLPSPGKTAGTMRKNGYQPPFHAANTIR